MTDTPTILALDFGTTNSLLAAAAPTRTFGPIALDPLAADPTIIRSVLHFTSAKDVAFGQAALRRYVDSGLQGRLLRSVKRHLGSRAFEATRIDGRRITIEDIVGFFLRAMRETACRAFDADIDRVVLGRPARFSHRDDEDALAEARLGRAARLAGFREVWFCYEPVAAAHDFAANFDRRRTVLIADFGGGTSDFTIARMTPTAFSPTDVLAVGGVSLAGDAFDGALVRAVAAPLLGSEAPYRVPTGSNILTMPGELLQLLCSPASLTLTEPRGILQKIDGIRAGLLDEDDVRLLDRFSVLIADAVGYQFYESVEGTKVQLSRTDEAVLQFAYPGIDLVSPVTRTEFERAVRAPFDRILEALDRTLANAAMAPSDIEVACLTGGTSMVPILESALRAKLGNAQVVRLRSHHSVVQGLAHCAQALEAGIGAAGIVAHPGTVAPS